MGKSRGKGGKGRGKRDDEEEAEPVRIGAQSANVGMLPPSDSEEDEDEEEVPAKASTQPKTAGLMPPSDDDEEDDDDEDDDDEDSDEAPEPAYLTESAPRRRKDKEEAPDPEQIRRDIERLELIKKKREEQRLKRIAEEGWDRFAPPSDTNKPPGTVPSDHPDTKS